MRPSAEASYSLIILNVGLLTMSLTPIPLAIPLVKHVLPLPSSPISAIQSPFFKFLENLTPNFSVSFADFVSSSNLFTGFTFKMFISFF